VSLEFAVTLAALGGIGGFTAGLLGVGGGVVIFPLLLYIPPLLDLANLDAKTVAAVVVAQVFFSALVAGGAHLRSGRVHGRLTLIAGAISAVGAFLGGVASKWVSDRFLLLLFGTVALLVVVTMFLPCPSENQENVPADQVTVPLIPLSIFSFVTGMLAGFLGSGNFIFAPLLIYILKVPTRIAIGSSLLIAAINTSSGFLGKLITGQVPLFITVAVVLGAAIGALVGEKCHSKVSPQFLRHAYSVVVAIVALRIWLTLLVR
jgi:uncharacterized protein